MDIFMEISHPDKYDIMYCGEEFLGFNADQYNCQINGYEYTILFKNK